LIILDINHDFDIIQGPKYLITRYATFVDNLVAKHFNVDKPFVTELAKALYDIKIQDNSNKQASTSNRVGIFKQDSLSADMAADSRVTLLLEDGPGV
jgi:hypothetical protein